MATITTIFFPELKPWLSFVREHGNSERILDVFVVVKLLPILKHFINLNTENKFHRIMNVAYLKVTQRALFSSCFVYFLGGGLLMSFHRHSCPSILITSHADAGIACHVFFFF